MNLLPWFLKIPGHEQNVRIPSSPHQVAMVDDIIETEEPPMRFTWGSTPGSEWDFDISFEVKQGIPKDLTWDTPTRQEDRVKVPWVPGTSSSSSSGVLPLALTWRRGLTEFAIYETYYWLEGPGSQKMLEEQAMWEPVAKRIGLKLLFPNMLFMDAKPPGT